MGYGDTLFLNTQGVTSPTKGVNNAASPVPSPTYVSGEGSIIAQAPDLYRPSAPTVNYTPPSGGGPGAPAPPPPNNPAPAGPPQWYLDYLASLDKKRQSAFDEMTATLRQYGIDIDGSFSNMIRGWIFDDKSPDWVMMEIRKSEPYNRRFTGMADLIKRGQFMSEAEYIAQERAYRGVMQSWGLPNNFYDDPTDYGRFIANGVSVKELDDRIASAKTFLDNTDPTYRNALRDLYGVNEGGMLAYVLDGDKAQSVLQQQFKASAFAGSAANYDFGLDKAAAEKYGATLGDQYNRIGADQVNALNTRMSALDEIADNQQSLAFIDNETYKRTDTLDAEVLNDSDKRMASQRRALREKARFSGSSAFGRGSLARSSGA